MRVSHEEPGRLSAGSGPDHAPQQRRRGHDRRPGSQDERRTLRFELDHFVCEGQYRSGLVRILETYVSHQGQPEQPAAWISGFFGSGKSHLAKMLRFLWMDYTFPEDGASARGLARLPNDVMELLTEISTLGRRGQGLHAAAGTLGAGAGDSVRLALLGIVFKSARSSRGLPAGALLPLAQEERNLRPGSAQPIEAEGRNLSPRAERLVRESADRQGIARFPSTRASPTARRLRERALRSPVPQAEGHHDRRVRRRRSRMRSPPKAGCRGPS